MLSYLYLCGAFLALLGLWLGDIGALGIQAKLMWTGMGIAGMVPVMWIDTLLYFGWGVLRTIPMMTRCFFSSKRGSTLCGMLVLSLCFWLSPFATQPFAYRYHLSLGLVLVVSLMWLQPPSVLLLGASNKQTGKALGRISAALNPLRVIALLDHRKTGYIIGGFSLFTDNLRTESDYHWRSTVDQLSAYVPLIILDARSDTPIVIEEAKLILNDPARRQRSCFIVAGNGDAPALQAHGVTAGDEGLMIIKEDSIHTALKSWLKAKRTGVPRKKDNAS